MVRRQLYLALGGALIVIGALVWWFKVDGSEPVARLEGDSEVVGRNAEWAVDIRSPGRSGIASVEIRLVSGDRNFALAERRFEANGWFGSGVDALRVPVEADLGSLGVPEGPAALEVLVETHGWRLFDRPAPIAGRFPQVVDRTPPSGEVISDQHNLRVGGSAIGIFRVAPDATDVEVVVGNYRFPVTRGYFRDPALMLGVFAVPQDVLPSVQPTLRVRDAVGNILDVPIRSDIRPRQFRERTLRIGDQFLARKIPQLYSAQGLGVPGSLLEGYLRVNGEGRRESEKRLAEVAGKTEPRVLWSGAFRRLARSETMSEFGDRRSYSYEGKIVDKQTHLGVDLASLKRAEIGAAQNGVVVFAGDLGIYGATVVLDHGLGVATLYGHLSSIEVAVGDRVEVGHILGRSGESGLAGGDHLHFSTMVHGVHVDPAEWWDAKWLRDHVDAKISTFPPAHTVLTEGEADGQ